MRRQNASQVVWMRDPLQDLLSLGAIAMKCGCNGGGTFNCGEFSCSSFKCSPYSSTYNA